MNLQRKILKFLLALFVLPLFRAEQCNVSISYIKMIEETQKQLRLYGNLLYKDQNNGWNKYACTVTCFTEHLFSTWNDIAVELKQASVEPELSNWAHYHPPYYNQFLDSLLEFEELLEEIYREEICSLKISYALVGQDLSKSFYQSYHNGLCYYPNSNNKEKPINCLYEGANLGCGSNPPERCENTLKK